jgi:hypothetical protein
MTILSANHRNSNWEEHVVIAGTVRPNFLRDDFPKSAEWVRFERTQHGKFCQLSLDLWPCSYNFAESPEVDHFRGHYKDYLSNLRKSGRFPRGGIDYSLPSAGSGFVSITVLREDCEQWAERLRALVKLGNLQLIPGAERLVARAKARE